MGYLFTCKLLVIIEYRFIQLKLVKLKKIIHLFPLKIHHLIFYFQYSADGRILIIEPVLNKKKTFSQKKNEIKENKSFYLHMLPQ